MMANELSAGRNLPPLKRMNLRKTIRLLQVLVAITTLVAFTIVASSALHHHTSAEDSHCPYCHMGHQSTVQPESSQHVTMLAVLASLLLPEAVTFADRQVFSHTPTRAPPFA
jgi:Protein of unknown function (DUF2946)